MYQTRILTNFEKFTADQFDAYMVDIQEVIDTLKLQGKTDGIIIYDPPLDQNSLERYLIRTWIDRAAAEEWIAGRNTICVKYGLDLATYSITEIA